MQIFGHHICFLEPIKMNDKVFERGLIFEGLQMADVIPH